MLVDARGRGHPEHLKELKRHLQGLCAVFEDLEVLIDDHPKERKMLELYIRTFNAPYTVEEGDGFVKVTIKAPFNICGF